jgi:hypothetical protein
MSEVDPKSEGLGAEGVRSVLPAFEPHFTVQQIAEMWNLSADAIRRLFRGEPGVVEIKSERSAYRRRSYTSLRIPRSVAERVHRRLSLVK